MTTITEQLAASLGGIDEMCQQGLNSETPAHWEAALQDVMQAAREALAAYDAQPKDKARALLVEFDNRFGNDVSEDAEIDACDAVDFLTDFAIRVRAALES